MVWSNENVREIVRHLGPTATLWILAIIDKNIGKNKAHNYTVFPGKIQSLAKKYDRDPPQGDEISAAFDKLKRIPISTPDGREDTIIQGDKQEYVKLTDHGITLVTLIDNRPTLNQFIKEFLSGEPQEVDDWFPAPSPDHAPVHFRTTSDPPSEDEEQYEAEAIAEFDCQYSDCNGEIEEAFSFVYPDDMWSKEICGECPECEEIWECVVGDSFSEPSKSVS